MTTQFKWLVRIREVSDGVVTTYGFDDGTMATEWRADNEPREPQARTWISGNGGETWARFGLFYSDYGHCGDNADTAFSKCDKSTDEVPLGQGEPVRPPAKKGSVSEAYANGPPCDEA